MADPETRAAVLEAQFSAHMRSDDERHNRIESNLSDIKEGIRDLAKTVNEAVQRIHGRIDTEAETARKATGAVDDRLGTHKTAILTTAISGAVAVIGFLADKLWKH